MDRPQREGRRRGFGPVEVVLAVVTAVVATMAAATVSLAPARRAGPALVGDDLLRVVQGRYGEKYSQGPEEWLIRDFFQDQRDGVFVDVGAYDPIKWSNTYRLERDFGWSGVAIDAISDFAPHYTRERPRTRFVVAFVADRDAGATTLHMNPRELAVSSSVERFTRQFTATIESREVPNRTLDGILAEASIGRIDLLSMDIELGEPAALAHFSIGRYRPRLAVVEAQLESRQVLLDYFAEANYVVVGKYLRADQVNLYFQPRSLN